MRRRFKKPAPPPGLQAIDTHDWEKLPPCLDAKPIARDAAVSKLFPVVRKWDGSLDETLLPGPDDPLQVPIIVEGARFVVSLAWRRCSKYFRWLLLCPVCSRWRARLLLKDGLQCKKCAGVKARHGRLPKILKPIAKLAAWEKKQQVERRNARIAGRQRFRRGVTVDIEV